MGLPGVYFANDDAAAELVSSDEALAAVTAITKAAAVIAKESTPVVTGEHRDAIFAGEAVVDPTTGAATGILGSTSSTWHLVEFGSVNNPAYRSMTHGAEAAGLTFVPEGQTADTGTEGVAETSG